MKSGILLTASGRELSETVFAMHWQIQGRIIYTFQRVNSVIGLICARVFLYICVMQLSDEYFMQLALKEAQRAFEDDEIPVGAVVVCKNTVVAKGYNMTEKLNDVTAHAEMIAFTAAATYLNSKYLWDCKLYVTLEPCVMCAGAAFWTQIPAVIFGAYDEKRGFRRAGNLLHPSAEIKGGVMEAECSTILKEYFRKKREGF